MPAARDRPRLVAAALPVATPAAADELRLPSGVLVLLAGAFALLLVTAAVAIVPAQALPSRVAAVVDGRRELLVFVALSALGLVFALALLVALASS